MGDASKVQVMAAVPVCQYVHLLPRSLTVKTLQRLATELEDYWQVE
jgi:hypothetical protein